VEPEIQICFQLTLGLDGGYTFFGSCSLEVSISIKGIPFWVFEWYHKILFRWTSVCHKTFLKYLNPYQILGLDPSYLLGEVTFLWYSPSIVPFDLWVFFLKILFETRAWSLVGLYILGFGATSERKGWKQTEKRMVLNIKAKFVCCVKAEHGVPVMELLVA